MTRSRISRKARSRAGDARRVPLYAVVGLVFLLIIGAAALRLGTTRIEAQAEIPVDQLQPSATAAASLSAVSTEPVSATSMVEVPDVVGRSTEEARMLLGAAGFAVEERIVENRLAPDAVLGQTPAAGNIVTAGLTVVLDVSGGRTVDTPGAYVVCIDPGHQAKSDRNPEPIGPGSSETKHRVTGGATGVATRLPEYEIALQISMNLKARLERAGVTVVMTRTTNDVNISNAERAAIANEAGADLFVRVHADGSTDPATAGISTLYPGANRWTGTIAGPSKIAATFVQDATIAATGATSRGTVARTDLSGFNWATVPSVLVECGFMSNSVEDRLLSSPHYQDKLAEGMAAGIVRYLDSTQ
ncbi:MAG: N-acetylmuramoyl-L-alanine amidase [Actinomycetota bacterium]|nr:N-acetylmuramoyl-L-alanine amidase [Actinomycetota bacterium]MDZ4177752.1 N-acetylmuramoyl-L-alanine amidase [Coriobacteriia bacterium]